MRINHVNGGTPNSPSKSKDKGFVSIGDALAEKARAQLVPKPPKKDTKKK